MSIYRAVTASKFMDRPSDAPISTIVFVAIFMILFYTACVETGQERGTLHPLFQSV
jgi:cytochrome c oxidase assembly factor CtaG